MANVIESGGSPWRKIRLVRPAHIYYKHKDINSARQFLVDFGFTEAKQVGEKTYYKGLSNEPFLYCAIEADENEFGGAAFVVESEADLQYASETLPGATEIYELSDAPGGGLCVTFKDPKDGFPFHLVYGQKMDESQVALPQRDFNLPLTKNRLANRFQRMEKAPAPVHRLGHFGMCVTDFQATFDFYLPRFNLKPSDLIHLEDGRVVTAFNRLDRGTELVDHHAFFFYEGPRSHVHHASFETHDFDTQVLGHDWLRHKGYKNCWGVGRHVLGSQIFDYWFDPSGYVVEHYADGDLCDSSEPTHRMLAGPDNLHIWGEPRSPPPFPRVKKCFCVLLMRRSDLCLLGGIRALGKAGQVGMLVSRC
ncbi:hypothetical protein QWA68_015692 [Fusarium oxysporum]|nr:hypothetical protein QWA68_015692 [Fusarium oxysporum]